MRIGIDIGGSHIGIGLINDGEIIELTEKEIYKKETEDSILNYIDKVISEIIEKTKDVDLIGIATPGYIQGYCMKNLVNLGIDKLDFTELQKKYKNIKMQIKNDSKAAALAEKEYGALKNYEDAVFLCLGTGIGSGVFLNGKLLQAQGNLGFELGHMIIDKNGEKCNCGKRGCFETYCSIKRFKDNVKRVLGIDEISSIELLNKAIEEMNNPKIKKLIEEFMDNLIVGLSNIIDIFQPEAICLGGSFVFFKDIFYEKIQNEMYLRKYVFNKDKLPKILLASLGNDAGMIGAVID